MPPRGRPPKAATAAAAKASPAGKAGKATIKKDVDNDDDEDYEEPATKAKSSGRKRVPSKKALEAAQAVKDEQEDDGDEDFPGDEDELDEEFDDEEDDEEEEDEEEVEEAAKQQKTLFIKNLPVSTTEAQIRAMCPDIQNCRIETSKKSGEPNPKYAVIDFIDEATAAKNLEMLRGQKVDGVDIIADYVGTQSIVTFVTPALTPSSDPLKLYVTGFGRDVTIEQLKAMFPTSHEISLPLNPKDNNRPIGYAFIHYLDEEICRTAHDNSQDLSYQNRTLVVMYGKKTPPPNVATLTSQADTKRKPTGAKRGPKPKKPKQEEPDDDDEDDDEGLDGDEDEEDGC